MERKIREILLEQKEELIKLKDNIIKIEKYQDSLSKLIEEVDETNFSSDINSEQSLSSYEEGYFDNDSIDNDSIDMLTATISGNLLKELNMEQPNKNIPKDLNDTWVPPSKPGLNNSEPLIYPKEFK